MSNVFTREWSSVTELMQYLNTTPNLAYPDIKESKSHKTGRDRHSFTGTANYKEAQALLANGWKEGAIKIQKLAAPAIEQIGSKIERAEILYDTTGAAFDIGAVCANEPECWQVFTPTIQEGRGNRILHVVFNGSISAGITTEQMIERGSFTVALVECLELAGFSVHLTMACGLRPGWGGERPTGNVDMLLTVKQPDQPVDLEHLAFVIAHPSFFRRFIFEAIEHESGNNFYKEAIGGWAGYGVPNETLLKSKADIYLPEYMYGQVYNTNRLLELVKEQGVTLTEDKSL